VATEHAHVFPRQLFLKPRPTNLPTVPSCEACNRSFGEDERLFAIATIDYDHPYGKRLWDRQVRPRLQHERSAGFRRMLARSVSPLLVPRDRGGAYGNPIHLDRERIKRVLSNVARGLAYHHAGDILPADTRFVFGIFGALDAPAPEIIGQLALGAPVRRRLGKDVFEYQWGLGPRRKLCVVQPPHVLWNARVRSDDNPCPSDGHACPCRVGDAGVRSHRERAAPFK